MDPSTKSKYSRISYYCKVIFSAVTEVWNLETNEGKTIEPTLPKRNFAFGIAMFIVDTNFCETENCKMTNCTCSDGFENNGVSCIDTNECFSQSHNCDTNADCFNSVGSFDCSCHTGFIGDGVTCQDIDECSTKSHNCENDAICVNSIGSFTCKEGKEMLMVLNFGIFKFVDEKFKKTNILSKFFSILP